ncbi:TonB-dependent siderophore receptor [Acinetobacter baumannii]
MQRTTKHFQINALALAIAMSTISAHAETDQQTSEYGILPTIKVKAGSGQENEKSYIAGKTDTAVPLGLSVREVPQSVSVITQQRLQDQQLSTLVEVAENVTGVSVNRYETNRGGIYSRGFVVDNYIIDGIPTTYSLPWSSGEIFSSMALYDHIDIVRGATGLTFGAGNPSAAINMVRKRATSTEPTANVEVSAGSWDNYRVMGDIANSLNQSGTVRGRAVAQYEQGDSYTDLLSKEKLTLLLSAEADLSENTLLSGGVTYQEDDPRGPMWGGLPVWFSDGTKTNWSKNTTTSADWTRWNVKYTNLFADLTHKFNDNWSAKLSYSHGKRDANSKLLFVPGSVDKNTGLGLSPYASAYDLEVEQDNASLQLNGSFDLWGLEQKVVLGYQYSNQDFTAYARSTDTKMEIGNFFEWNGSMPEPVWNAPTLNEKYNIEQNALFAATYLNPTEPLKFILGGRFTNYEKNIYGRSSSIKYDHEFVPYAGIIYDFNDVYTAYASYTSIFQPQDNKDFDGNYLDPVEGNSTEVGLKSAWFDGRLNGTLALYHIKQDNLAQEAGQVTRNGVKETYYRAAKGATSEGFEVEVSGQITPDWNITAGYSQFSAKDANDVDVNTQLPRKMIQTFTTYKLPGKLENITVGGGVNWQSSTYINAENPKEVIEKVEQGDYALVNLMARYQITKDFSAQLNINNVFDKKYYGVFPAYGQITLGAPRNAALTLQYKF